MPSGISIFFKSELASRFKLRDLGPLNVFLGVRFTRDRARRTITLSQQHYVESILERYGMDNCASARTPMATTPLELEKAMGKLGDGLTKKQMKAVEELSRGIVNKLLHGPMQALRSDGTDPAQVSQTLVNMHALEDMFDLKNDGVPGSRNGKK